MSNRLRLRCSVKDDDTDLAQSLWYSRMPRTVVWNEPSLVSDPVELSLTVPLLSRRIVLDSSSPAVTDWCGRTSRELGHTCPVVPKRVNPFRWSNTCCQPNRYLLTQWHYSPDGHKPPLIWFHSLNFSVFEEQVANLLPQHLFESAWFNNTLVNLNPSHPSPIRNKPQPFVLPCCIPTTAQPCSQS
jgi:hypothetical protein